MNDPHVGSAGHPGTSGIPDLTIDLNADIGETSDPDPATEEILRFVSSANVACGYHAGSRAVMEATVLAARDHGVVVGAHVSYLDRAGFGRRPVDVPSALLQRHLWDQVDTLARIAERAGSHVNYVKPHGALYHRAAADAETARVVADVVASLPGRNGVGAVLVVPPGSLLLTAASERGVTCVIEAFPDRAYRVGGDLVDRSAPDSVLTDVDQIARRAVALAVHGAVERADGAGLVPVAARTLCLHGDGPQAPAAARAVVQALRQAGVTIAPFAGP